MNHSIAVTSSFSLMFWLRAFGALAALAAAYGAQSLLLRGALASAFILYLAAGLTAVLAFRGLRVPTGDAIAANAPIRGRLSWGWLAASLACGGFAAAAAWMGAGRQDGAIWLRSAEFAWLAMIASLLIACRDTLLERVTRWRRGPWLPPAALALFALSVGTWRLTEIPRAVHGDEGMVGLHARMIGNGEIETLFSSSWYLLPQFFFTMPAASMALFGDDLFGLRMSAVLLGTLGAVILYSTARAWWGEIPALLAVFLHLCNHWNLYLLRSGVQYGQAAFFYIAMLALWRSANRNRSSAMCLLAGVVLGFALMSYQANHLLPFLWIASQIYLWLTGRITPRWLVLSTLLPLVMAAMTLAPLVAHNYRLAGSIEVFSARASAVSIWKENNWAHLEHEYKTQGKPGVVWANQFYRAFLAPFAVLDRSGQFRGSSPMLDVVSAALLGVSIVLALSRWRDPRWAIPLIGSAMVFLVGGALAIDTPFYPRLAGASPMLTLLIAGLLAHLLHLGLNWAAPVRLAWTAAAAALVLYAASLNWSQFFNVYATQDGALNVHFVQTRLAERIRQLPEGRQVFVFIGGHVRFNSGTVMFLAKNANGRDVEGLEDFLIWYRGNEPIVVIITSDRRNELGPLLQRFPQAHTHIHTRPNGDLLFYEVTIHPLSAGW